MIRNTRTPPMYLVILKNMHMLRAYAQKRLKKTSSFHFWLINSSVQAGSEDEGSYK